MQEDTVVLRKGHSYSCAKFVFGTEMFDYTKPPDKNLISDLNPNELSKKLKDMGINYRYIYIMKLPRGQLRGYIRMAPHYYSTETLTCAFKNISNIPLRLELPFNSEIHTIEDLKLFETCFKRFNMKLEDNIYQEGEPYLKEIKNICVDTFKLEDYYMFI